MRDINNLIQFTNNGDLSPATYVEIVQVLTNEFKAIYGNDIDVSQASADGQYINNIALIINNILQSTKYLFNQLNPNTATGKFLDILCSYNNIQRIGNTASTCQLVVKNITGQDIQAETISNILFEDNVGNYWIWQNPKILNDSGNIVKSVSFPVGEEVLLTDVTCERLGEINNINDIDTIDYGTLEIVADSNGEKIHNLINGTNEESDSTLRSRRIESLGSESVSILSGLVSSLLNIYGVEDVWIYNNSLSSAITLSQANGGDDTSVNPHSIYICVRYKEDVTDNDVSNLNYNIGTLIYNKLTPGIGTSQATSSTKGGENRKYTLSKSDSLKYNIYWKKCTSSKPTITINYDCSSEYPFVGGNTAHTPSNDLEENIAKTLINYLNNINIGDKMQVNNIQTTFLSNNYLDSSNGSIMYITNSRIDASDYAEGNANSLICTAPLSYFYYEKSDFKFTYNTTTNKATLVIGG